MLDGAVMMYNLSVHQQLGKVSPRASQMWVGCKVLPGGKQQEASSGRGGGLARKGLSWAPGWSRLGLTKGHPAHVVSNVRWWVCLMMSTSMPSP